MTSDVGACSLVYQLQLENSSLKFPMKIINLNDADKNLKNETEKNTFTQK
jgi:hypothetical protein